MITCLTDYIGLRDITPGSPKSGRYINELQGIDTRQFELIEAQETYDTLDAWRDVENRAIRKYEMELMKWAKKYFQNYSYQSNVVSSQIDRKSQISNSNNYAGWFFDGNWSFFKNMNLQIPSVELWSDSDVETKIFVFNASTGDLIEDIDIDLMANQINTVTINKQYALWRYPKLFICYDESVVTTLKVTDLAFGNIPQFSQRRVNKSSDIVPSNLSGVGSSGQGMNIIYSAECALDNYVCQRLRLFEESYMYMLGVEFCNERLYSDRISQYTLLDRDRAEELRNDFQSTFDDMIKAVLGGLTIDYGNDDFCFACDRAITYKVLLP